MVITIWNEFRHEKQEAAVAAIYPNGIHACVAEFLKAPDVEIRLAALDDPDNGLPPEVLETTDVLMWWGHMAHGEVPDALVDRIQNRIQRGMGLVVMHSGHHSKLFKRMAGTTGNLVWGDDCHERVFNVNPGHPIAAGIPEHFELGIEEMYGEPFDIPQPNETIFMSWFESGYLFRSGFTFQRGRGRIFYFQPGHEYCRSFYNPYVQQVLKNAVRWVCPTEVVPELVCPYVKALTPDSDAK